MCIPPTCIFRFVASGLHISDAYFRILFSELYVPSCIFPSCIFQFVFTGLYFLNRVFRLVQIFIISTCTFRFSFRFLLPRLVFSDLQLPICIFPIGIFQFVFSELYFPGQYFPNCIYKLLFFISIIIFLCIRFEFPDLYFQVCTFRFKSVGSYFCFGFSCLFSQTVFSVFHVPICTFRLVFSDWYFSNLNLPTCTF